MAPDIVLVRLQVLLRRSCRKLSLSGQNLTRPCSPAGRMPAPTASTPPVARWGRRADVLFACRTSPALQLMSSPPWSCSLSPAGRTGDVESALKCRRGRTSPYHTPPRGIKSSRTAKPQGPRRVCADAGPVPLKAERPRARVSADPSSGDLRTPQIRSASSGSFSRRTSISSRLIG